VSVVRQFESARPGRLHVACLCFCTRAEHVAAVLTCVAVRALADADGVKGHDLRFSTPRARRTRTIRIGLDAEHSPSLGWAGRQLYHSYQKMG
jgi:hypothetical protein